MGGRQKGKKQNDSISISETDTQTVSEAPQAENIAADNMQLHKAAEFSVDELKALRQLSEVRTDDPRVKELSPMDPRLVLDKFNVRKERDAGFLKDLHESMVEEGQQKAIIVMPRGEELWVVAGNTRVRAAKLGDIKSVFVLSQALTDEQAWFVALQSNLDNSLPMHSLSDEEQGIAIVRLTEDYGMTQQQVADLIHRDQSWVSRQIRLAKVDPDVEAMVKKELITESHAVVIMTLPKSLQSSLADKVADDELTVQSTQVIVNGIKKVLKEADGLPDDLLEEDILYGVMHGTIKPEEAAKKAAAVSAGLKLLRDEVRDMDYGEESNFAGAIIEKKMDVATAQEFTKSLNMLWDEASAIPQENRETLIERLLSGEFTLEHRNLASVFEDARKAIKVIQLATESKGLPKPIRELVAKELEGSSYTIEQAEELISRLQPVFEVAKAFPDGVQATLANRIIQKKMTVKIAEALARTIEATIQEAKEIKSKRIKSFLLKHIAEHNYTMEMAKQLIDSVKNAEKKHSEWEITNELEYDKPKQWKILALTPEIEKAHEEEEAEKLKKQEEDSAAKVLDMLAKHEITPSIAEAIQTLPKIIQGETARSLDRGYRDNSGNRQALDAIAARDLVQAVQLEIAGKSTDELARLQTWQIQALQDIRRYAKKQQIPQPQVVVPEEAQARSQETVARIASHEAVSEQDAKFAEDLNQVAAQHDEPTDVEDYTNAEKVRVFKFPCPHCQAKIVLNPDELTATVEKN